jgi:hypothetical protein
MLFSPRWFLFLPLSLASLVAQTTTLNLSTDLTTLGIASSNLVPNQPTLDSGPLFEAGVKYAASHQMTQVVATTGSYYFLSGSAVNPAAHVLLAGLSAALTIDLQGSDLYFSHPEKFGFFLANLTNLTLQNFTMDYLQQRYTQLLVTGINAGQRQVQFTVQPGWQTPTALSGLNSVLAANGAPETYVYFFRNGQPWIGFTRMTVQTPYTDSQLTLATSVPAATVAAIRVGDVAVLNLRAGGNAIQATGLTGSTLRNIKVYSGLVGVRTAGGSSNLLEHVEVVPRPGTDRLISTIADGISPSQPGTNNTVRLCRSIRTCDDAFSPNVLVYGSIQSAPSTRTVVAQGDVDTALNGNMALPNGSNVAFERPTDGAVLASAVVVAQTATVVVGGLNQVTLTLDRDLPAGLAGTYVYGTDPSWRGGGLLLERNAVEQQGWARGMSVWGLMNSTLYGNYIRRSSMAGIALMHQLPPPTDFIVPPVVNLTLINNVIDGTITGPDIHTLIQLAGIQVNAKSSAGAPMTSSPNQNIFFKSNFIADPARSAIWFGNTAGGLIDTNYLFNPDNNPNVALAYAPAAAQELQPLVVDASQNVSVGTNPIDTASRRVLVTDTAFRDLAAYAPAGTVRLSAFNLGALANPAVTLTDADAKVWSLAVTASSTHALDAQLPAGVGLGGAVVQVTGGAASFLGTLFIDSQDTIPALNQATFLVSPSATSVPAGATSLSFLVVTQPGTAYPVTAADAFVTAGPPPVGTGVLTVSLAANPGAARTTTIEIAGQPILLTQAGAGDPVIASAPQSQTVSSGNPVVFSSAATGAASYQWYLNGVALAGATGPNLTLNAATTANAGSYTVVATNANGSAMSTGALLTVANSPLVSRLSNLSILTSISAATPAFTVGTVIGGAGTAGSKGLLVRAGGPALAPLGVTGTLADPTLTVFSGQTVAASNDNWGGTAALTQAFAAVGAFPYPSATSKDAAVYNPALLTGGYTVQVSGVGGTTGTVIAEIYDSTPTTQLTALTPRLINVSVLKNIASGEILTAGFVIAGSSAKQVLIRASGPTLAAAPFNLTGTMADPQISLYSGQTVIKSNDNWGGDPALAAASAAVGAFALTSASSKDAAVLATLTPGPYTVQVSGVAGSSGQALVEVYEVP